jgi:UDP-glucose 4-epimerase
MKTILVTGGAGFIGSHVVDRLLFEGYRVIVADNLSTGHRTNVSSGAEFHWVDVTSSHLHGLVQQSEPDAIIHLAAQVSVSESTKDPFHDTTVNVLGTVNVLEAARRFGVQNFVFASSAAVYGTPESLPLAENAPLDPMSPYGIAKLTSERYVQNYCSLFGLRAVITRYANVYGPRQLPEGDGGVVAKFMERVVSGQAPLIQGDGMQTRDFVYVSDVAAANHLALQYLLRTSQAACITCNIGTGERVSLLHLCDLITSLYPEAPAPSHVEPRIGDIRHSCLDRSRAYTYLGWTPQATLERGLRETLAQWIASTPRNAVS